MHHEPKKRIMARPQHQRASWKNTDHQKTADPGTPERRSREPSSSRDIVATNGTIFDDIKRI